MYEPTPVEETSGPTVTALSALSSALSASTMSEPASEGGSASEPAPAPASTPLKMRVAVFGHQGWIGQQLIAELEKAGHEVVRPEHVRADDEVAVAAFLDEERPTHVFSAIGRTHGPGCGTIDYLEDKLALNLRDNLYAPLVLALACASRNTHFAYLGTGCVFSSVRSSRDVAEDTVRKSLGYTEASRPDFSGSGYSAVKGVTDQIFHLPELSRHVLNLRIRMPITPDVHPRNFITKIATYDRVCSIPNSMSVLPTLMPVAVDLMARRAVGTLNLTNPGVISHDEILAMYRDIVDPGFTWRNFSSEDQDAALASKRSNNKLCTDLLEREYPAVPHIHAAVRDCLVAMATAAATSAQ